MRSLVSKFLSMFMAIILVIGLLPATALATELSEAEHTIDTEMYSDTAVAPEGYVPRNITFDNMAVLAASDVTQEETEELPRVLLIEDVLPWDSTANQEVLAQICDYDKTTTTDFLNVELENYGVVVFANDQPFNTYDNYAAFKEYLELFANLGGVIVFGACDAGWSNGNLVEKLPGDVSKKTHYVYNNYIVDYNHPIVTASLSDMISLENDDLYNNYCSHVSFDEESLPAGTKIILRESDTDRPTLVEYPLGEGRVIASGLTWEHCYTLQHGRFGQKALDDLYKYAIRVSNIDVDELQQLENWRINKKAHTIIVADSSNGLSSLTPIAGATVRVEEPASHSGEDLITDQDGVVSTTDYGLRTVSVKATGYRDYAELYQISEQNSRIIPLEKDRNDGLPYLSMCSAAKNGSQDFVDLRNQALHYTEDKSDTLLLWLRGNWGEHGEGYFRVYQESVAGVPGKEFQVPVGSYLNTMPGKYFVPDVPVKIQMVAANGTKSEVVELNIEINKAPVVGGPTENTAIQEFTNVDWLGNFPISSDNEIFTKLLTTDMSVSSDLIPVEFVIDHKDDGTISYKGTIGFVKGEGSKNIKNNKSQEKDFKLESAWETLKDEVKGYKKAGNPQKYWQTIDKKYGSKLHGTRLRSSIDTDFKFLGFIEVTTDQNGKIISSDGGLISSASASLVIGKTFFAGPVPLYFEFKPGIDAEISGGVTFYNEENGLTFKLNFAGLDLAIPSISLEGGVGVRGVATAGLNGTGKLKFGLLHEDSPFNVDLSLDGSVHIKVLFVADYKWSFASTNIHFYPKNRAINDGVALAMSEIDENSLSLTSREYLSNATSWMGTPVSLMALGEEPVAVTTLQQGTMPDAMPQIHKINGKQIILFLRDVEDRAVGNHTQLVYSVENNGVWSEPTPVFESDTADFFFSSAICNGDLVVAWQKSKSSAQSLDANELLSEIAGNSEIYVAYFDNGSETFKNVQCLTDNNVIDMMPVISAAGEETYVSWISNDANNVLGSDGTYHVHQATLNNDSVETDLLYSTTEYVVEIAAGEKNVLIATANNDGSSNLYAIKGNSANQIATNTNAAGLAWNENIFTWQADGSLYGYSPSADTVEVILASSAAASSSYEFITNGTRTAVVWTESSEEGYLVKTSFNCDNKWSSPIVLLSGEDDTVAFMDAQMLDDDSISVIMNAVSYTEAGDVELTSLQYANLIPQTNLSVTLVEPDYPDWENQTQTIDIVLDNTGENPIYSADLCVGTEDGTLISEILSLVLLPGESTVISKEVSISNIDELTELTVSVNVDNDVDDSDNEQSIFVGQTDTSLSVNTYIQGEEYLFVLTASNRSNTDANAAISIIEDSLNGVVLSMKNIGVVDNTENIQYLYTIDRSKVNFNGETTKTFFFALSTLEDDWFESDNVCSFSMKAPDSVVTDPEGQIELISIVDPTTVEIVEDVLHFDSSASESIQLHAIVLPDNATNTKVFWEIEDDSIAYVNEDGVVTALNPGITTITATVGDGITDTIQVSVGDTPVKTYTIIYTDGVDGAEIFADQIYTVSEGAATPIFDGIPTRSGFTFKGWTPDVAATVTETITYTATWEAVIPSKYTVTVNDSYATTTGAGEYEEGEIVTIYAGSRSGYSFTGWTSSDITIVNASSQTATFVMPDRTVTVTANWQKNNTGGGVVIPAVFPVNVKDSNNGKVEASAKYAVPGSTVKLTVTPDEGYELDNLSVKSNKEINVIEKNGKYQFTMPYGSVTVTATFKKIEAPVVPIVPSFEDVAADAYYFDAVKWAVENGITAGTSDTTFSPDMTCTRAQAVTFLWRAAGSPTPKSDAMPFNDVEAESYYYNAVLWAVESGITAGTSATTFSPNAECTRAQIVTFLWRSQKSPATIGVNPFIDVVADTYYTNAVLWAVAEKITAGTSETTFSPDADCTRAQIVTFLYRCLGDE